MPRTKQTAADYIERHDAEMRIILGELMEYAGKVNAWWTMAREHVRKDPEQALTNLADAETHLDIHVRIELRDSLRRIRAALDLLDAELPDEEGDASEPMTTSSDIPGR